MERSTVVLSLLFEISRLYGGFFTSPAQLESFPQWEFCDALSYIKYVFVGVSLNQLEGLDFTCKPGVVSIISALFTYYHIMLFNGLQRDRYILSIFDELYSITKHPISKCQNIKQSD